MVLNARAKILSIISKGVWNGGRTKLLGENHLLRISNYIPKLRKYVKFYGKNVKAYK